MFPACSRLQKDDGAALITARSMTFPSTGFRVAIAMLAGLDLRYLLQPRARLLALPVNRAHLMQKKLILR